MTVLSADALSQSVFRSVPEPSINVSSNREVLPAPPLLLSLMAGVLELTRLPRDWDGEGGVPVTQSALETASQLLVDAHSYRAIPHVMPMNSGALLLEWRRAERVLHIEISADGNAEYDRAIANELVDEGILRTNSGELFAWLIDGLGYS